MKKYKLMVDPPSGWRYGFPKEIPEEFLDEEAEIIDKVGYMIWFHNLYPVEDTLYCRYWKIPIENDN